MRFNWLTDSQSFYNSYATGELLQSAKGGVAYNFQASQVLNDAFKLEVAPSFVRHENENIFRYWHKIHRLHFQADIIIKDPMVITLGKKRFCDFEIGMIHHIDDLNTINSLKKQLYINKLRHRLKHLDLIVTVSEYWRKQLISMDCRTVEVIYNSFNLNEFSFSDSELSEFCKLYGLDREKPIIYIGNASLQKGVVEVYQALKNENYTLVMSGKKEGDLGIPVLHLDLSRRDYLRLLKISKVVIAFSTMVEGWNRTVHEAMLCKTPVIGSGTGGMKELLEGGGQITLPNITGLPSAVRKVLSDRPFFSNRSYAYAKQYDSCYFKDAWNSLFSKAIAMKNELK